MATIIYPNTNGKSYFNMGYAHESVRASSSQGISKMIAVKSNSNSGDRIHKRFFTIQALPGSRNYSRHTGVEVESLGIDKN
jgi:hypothetical protein